MKTFVISTALEAAAVLVCAVSGMITATRKRMDIVGTYCLAVVTAFGGGTLRDLLIDRRPFFWVSHDQYLLILVVLCVAFVYSRSFYARASRWHRQGDRRGRDGLRALHADGRGVRGGQGYAALRRRRSSA